MVIRKYYEWLQNNHNEKTQLLQKTILGAERFVFSDYATFACYDLARFPKVTEAAKDQIFAPFPNHWIEFADMREKLDIDAMGFLWTGKDNARHGVLWIVLWDSRLSKPNHLHMEIDLDNDLARVKISEWLDDEWSKIGKKHGESDYPEVAKTSYFRALLSAWALLASKGMTETVQPDFSKINKHRTAKGLYPLLAYREIKLTLDAERAVKTKIAVGTGHMPLHSVRAHLRLLATGKVVIVKAHMRGNPDYGTRLHRYTVQTSDDLAS